MSTERVQAAMAAMQGILIQYSVPDSDADWLVKRSVLFADALLAELARTEPVRDVDWMAEARRLREERNEARALVRELIHLSVVESEAENNIWINSRDAIARWDTEGK